jgi:hypothetical protein
MRRTLLLALIGTAAAFAPATMPATLARRGAAQSLGALRMAQGASSVYEERRRALQVSGPCGDWLLGSCLCEKGAHRAGPVVDRFGMRTCPILSRDQ